MPKVSAQQFAELFHHSHQSLVPDSPCWTDQVRKSWMDVQEDDRNRMVAAARLALLELGSVGQERENSRRYFAERGEAEWGC
jgi:hypothetical protein